MGRRAGSFFARAKVPTYRKHRASGQAIVTLSGKDFYLGRHGSAVSKRKYDWLVCEWLENDRHVPRVDVQQDLRISELAIRYWKYATGYYVKYGRKTDTQYHVKALLSPAQGVVLGHECHRFRSPIAQGTAAKMLEDGLSRRYVNKQIGQLVCVFKWAASEELLPASIYQNLQSVPGLRRGRTSAPDYEPVAPVSEDVVQETLAHLSATVADMVRLQRLCGCRPEEICQLFHNLRASRQTQLAN